MNDIELFKEILKLSGSNVNLPSPPIEVVSHLSTARQIVCNIGDRLAVGTHAQYFNVSKERYAHYLAAAMWRLQAPAKILDIGNAPGHVAAAIESLGHDITGVNLNAAWKSSYPDPELYSRFKVVEHDIEKGPLSFGNCEFDAIIFTEVLEHVAIAHPRDLLGYFAKVLRQDGVLIFSTPNVCNISNIHSLINGKNIFWPPSRFYGGLDRHNREYTPAEVSELFRECGWQELALWGMSDHSNWRGGGGNQFAYDFIAQVGDDSPLLRNTIVGVFKPPK